MAQRECGFYRTTEAIGSVPAGRLVYYHNHGDPGPGIYLPESWRHNQAQFSKRGTTLEDPEAQAQTLEPLAAEGLYRVEREFACCAKECRMFRRDGLVQLGYNAAGEPILFEPTWTDDGLTIPERGQRVDADRIEKLTLLRVARRAPVTSEQLQLH